MTGISPLKNAELAPTIRLVVQHLFSIDMNTVNIFGNVYIRQQHINNKDPALAAPCDIENVAPAPPHQPRRARRAARGNSPFVCDNPAFWRKIDTLPVHLRFIFLPGCDLWDWRVYKRFLRLTVLHFVPGLFIRQRTSKPGYIRLFHEYVLASYGARYKNGN